MKAYAVFISGFSGMRQIVAARSRNSAKVGQYRSALDAGYEIAYLDMSAKRAPQYDADAAQYAGKVGPIVLGWETPRMGMYPAEKWGVLA